MDEKDVKNNWYPSNGTLFVVTKEGEVAIRLTPVNKHVSTPPFPKSDDNHWRLESAHFYTTALGTPARLLNGPLYDSGTERPSSNTEYTHLCLETKRETPLGTSASGAAIGSHRYLIVDRWIAIPSSDLRGYEA